MVKEMMEAKMYPSEGWAPTEITIHAGVPEWTTVSPLKVEELEKELKEAHKALNARCNANSEKERKFFLKEAYDLHDVLSSKRTLKVMKVLALKK